MPLSLRMQVIIYGQKIIKFIMKKYIVFLLLSILSIQTFAQNANNNLAEKLGKHLVADINIGTGTKHNCMTTAMVIDVKLGWKVTERLYPFANVESSRTLFEHANGNSWLKTNALGGGFGYTLSKATEKDRIQVDARGFVNAAIGDADWKRTSYNAELRLQIYGFGTISGTYRYSKSNTTGLPDHSGIIFSIGLGL